MQPADAMGPASGEIEFELGTSRSGAASLCLGGKRVHSAYDPEREATGQASRISGDADRVRAAAIVLIGAGLGYLPRALREQTRRPVIVWEPFGDVRSGLAAPGLGDAVTTVRDFERALAGANRRSGPIFLAVHPGYQELSRFEQRYALQALRRCGGVGSGLLPGSAILSERGLATLRRLPHLRPLDELGSCLAGRTAIIASGGPSLDPVLPALRERRGGVLLAAPQALERLLANDVRVDIVVNPDPADLLTPLLAPNDARIAAVVADASSHPAVLDHFSGRTFLFHLRSQQIHQLAWERSGLPVVDEPLVTVSETAYWVASTLGSRRILLAGVDFASDTRDYGAPFGARSSSGGWCSTNPVYFHGARYLAHAICRGSEGPTLEVRRLGDGVAVPGATAIGSDDVGRWLREEPGFPQPAAAGSAPSPLARSVRELVERDLPALSMQSPYPECEPWLGFEPLSAETATPRWRELRRELGVVAD